MRRGSVVVGFLDPGTWSACFGLSYRDLLLRDQASSQRIVRPGGVELRQLCGTGGIVTGRNRITADFLDRTDGEWLWMIDTDMGFAADTVDRLVAAAGSDRKVIGGLAFKQTRRRDKSDFYAERWSIQPTLYDWVELAEEVGFLPREPWPEDTRTDVAATGAACLLIHRDALVAVRDTYGDAWFNPTTHPGGDGRKPREFSEDLSFCVRLAACDIAIAVHTGIKTTHEKGGVFLDERSYREQYRATT